MGGDKASGLGPNVRFPSLLGYLRCISTKYLSLQKDKVKIHNLKMEITVSSTQPSIVLPSSKILNPNESLGLFIYKKID